MNKINTQTIILDKNESDTLNLITNVMLEIITAMVKFEKTGKQELGLPVINSSQLVKCAEVMEKIMETRHEAGFCSDPKCEYKLKKN